MYVHYNINKKYFTDSRPWENSMEMIYSNNALTLVNVIIILVVKCQYVNIMVMFRTKYI